MKFMTKKYLFNNICCQWKNLLFSLLIFVKFHCHKSHEQKEKQNRFHLFLAKKYYEKSEIYFVGKSCSVILLFSFSFWTLITIKEIIALHCKLFPILYTDYLSYLCCLEFSKAFSLFFTFFLNYFLHLYCCCPSHISANIIYNLP